MRGVSSAQTCVCRGGGNGVACACGRCCRACCCCRRTRRRHKHDVTLPTIRVVPAAPMTAGRATTPGRAARVARTGRSRSRQDSRDGRHGDGRRHLAHLLDVGDRGAAAARAGRQPAGRPGQRLFPGPSLSRLHGFAAARHAAGARRLRQRHALQRSVRRHGELGPDPGQRHRPRRRLERQSGVRPQRARRRGQRPAQERLHLQRRGARSPRRLVRPGQRLGAVWRPQGQCRGLCGGRRSHRPRLALPVAVADQARLWRRGLSGQRTRNPRQRRRGVELLRRDRADAGADARAGHQVDLHLAADHEKQNGVRRGQRQVRPERTVVDADRLLHAEVQPEARRRQRRGHRGMRPAVRRHPVPGRRRVSRPASRQFPDPQFLRRADPVRRRHAVRHGRPHLDRRAGVRRLAAVHQRRKAVRPRQFVHRRREHRPRPDQVRCQQRARIHLSRPVCRTERLGAGNRIADPYRGQHRLCPGDAERAQHLFTVFMHATRSTSPASFRLPPADGSTLRRLRWPTSSAPART